MCGEQRRGHVVEPHASGSSPRVRGTEYHGFDDYFLMGIIPACAGNSKWVTAWKYTFRDHPRVCGEQWRSRQAYKRVVGSSPRVRGTDYGAVNDEAIEGIIPACAGNSSYAQPGFRLWRDHPRVCGEQQAQRGSELLF